MQQNLIGFPNSIFPHVRPYTPYSCSNYNGIGSVLAMWSPMFNLVANIIAPLKPVLGVA
jgi:hypothetical protein